MLDEIKHKENFIKTLEEYILKGVNLFWDYSNMPKCQIAHFRRLSKPILIELFERMENPVSELSKGTASTAVESERYKHDSW